MTNAELHLSLLREPVNRETLEQPPYQSITPERIPFIPPRPFYSPTDLVVSSYFVTVRLFSWLMNFSIADWRDSGVIQACKNTIPTF